MPLTFNVHIQLHRIDDQQIYNQYFNSVDDLIEYVVDYFAKKAEHETEERVKTNVLKKPDRTG